MVQTQNSENNNPPDPIATQLAAIAAKLKVFETMKEDIAALKEGERSRSRSSRNGEGKSSWRGRQPQRPYNKIDFSIFSGGDPRGWLMEAEKYFRCGDKYEPRHLYKTGTLKVLEANKDVEEPLTTDLTNLESDPEETVKISLHAILRKPHPTTMKVHDVLVNELKLATQPLTPFGFQIGLGDRVKALKFITKAKRLDPLLQIDDLLKNLDEKNGFSKSPKNAASGDAREGSGGGSKVLGNGSGRVNGLGNGSSLGTNEQMTIVWEIRRKKDYYDILGMSKYCGVEDIRKAYLKLSLKVHPDKNKAPGSEEAFKKLSKAYECLSDAESRKKYNVMGSKEPMSYMPPTRRRASQNEFLMRVILMLRKFVGTSFFVG
nr:chaperone protein DnaJ 49-like [Tanacetum cinerariifolium]